MPLIARPGTTDRPASPGAGDRVPVVRGDQSLAFLLEGYAFGDRRFRELSTDVFRTRLLGRRITFLRGGDAAEFFYTEDRFTRVGGMPHTVLHSLQDEGSVQTLDGDQHRQRRALFLESLDEAGRAPLAHEFSRAWDAAWREWQSQGAKSLLTASGRVLTEAALRWAGVPIGEGHIDVRAREFLAMVDGAGSFGPRNVVGRTLRLRTERWARQLVRELRGRPDVAQDSPLGRLLAHREGGRELDAATAAVELLNLLRPVVAIARYIAFSGLALHLHPAWRERLSQDDTMLTPFVQEVRRTTPFFPGIGGRATTALSFKGVDMRPGDWVYVDMFATMRDPKRWLRPETFDPSRFVERDSPDLIPQGAGPMAGGHRCPGEPATVDLLALATRALARSSWSVPHQDLRVDLRRLPASPGAEGFTIVPGRAHR